MKTINQTLAQSSYILLAQLYPKDFLTTVTQSSQPSQNQLVRVQEEQHSTYKLIVNLILRNISESIQRMLSVKLIEIHGYMNSQ